MLLYPLFANLASIDSHCSRLLHLHTWQGHKKAQSISHVRKNNQRNKAQKRK